MTKAGLPVNDGEFDLSLAGFDTGQAWKHLVE
jgi:hypothetical protein